MKRYINSYPPVKPAILYYTSDISPINSSVVVQPTENETRERTNLVPSSCVLLFPRSRSYNFRGTGGENSCGGKWWIIKHFHFLALCAGPSRGGTRRRMTFPNKITDPTIASHKYPYIFSSFFFSNSSSRINPNKFDRFERKFEKIITLFSDTHRYIEWSWRNDFFTSWLTFCARSLSI